MGVLQAFRLGLRVPSKHAVFQLNRVKTKNFLLYIFLLHLVIALPNGAQLIRDSIIRGEFSKEFLLIFFIYPSFIILFGVAGISILASIGLLIRKITKRKLVYQLLWKMTVYALTYPIGLYTIFDLTGITNGFTNFFLLTIFLVIFIKMILVYPPIRKKTIQ